jgi:hypothetical protein
MSSGVIRAELKGSSCCKSLGISARGSAPVLALCRTLVKAGHDPRRPLYVYRSNVLALIVRSLGNGARLRVATHGVGFERACGCTGGPPVRASKPLGVGGARHAHGSQAAPRGTRK